MQRYFGTRQKTLSIAKAYLKFKEVGAMNAERRYKFNAAARYAFASFAALKDRNEISQT